MKKLLLIGISCFNEEGNIALLIEKLYQQKQVEFDLLVVNDGSTDSTGQILTKLKKKYHFLTINHNINQGLASCQNAILQTRNYEYYLLLNGDILPSGENFLSQLLHAAKSTPAQLVSCQLKAVKSRNWLQEILQVAHSFKTCYFHELAGGDNVWNFFGPVKLVHHSLSQKVKFPFSISEDAYLYLFAKIQGFSYQEAPTFVYFALPSTLKDYFNQATRAWGGQKMLLQALGPKCQKYFMHNYFLLSKIFLYFFVHYPWQMLFYVFLTNISKIMVLKNITSSQHWQSVSSTKQLLV